MCDVVSNYNEQFKLLKTSNYFVCKLWTLFLTLNAFTLYFASALHDVGNYVNAFVFKHWFAD